uniref:Uncharacterized protein n=1 Tax=Bionectria ochroleuca TaxID=29856 RepID=A0A8H7TQN7_BIOOC
MATALVPGPITYLVGNFVWINVLLVNAVAVLSEDRFLARIGRPVPRVPRPFLRRWPRHQRQGQDHQPDIQHSDYHEK